jgi:hypothetical protein
VVGYVGRHSGVLVPCQDNLLVVPRDADARAICHTEEGMEQTIGGGDGGCIEGKINLLLLKKIKKNKDKQKKIRTNK